MSSLMPSALLGIYCNAQNELAPARLQYPFYHAVG